MPTLDTCSLAALMAVALAVSAPAQGIEAKRGAVVLFGSTSNTTRPATIDMDRVEKETPEWETIRSEGVRKGSARYEILVAQMHKRIKAACKAAAEGDGVDCVVRHGDVKDAHGLDVVDLTDSVIDSLETQDARA